MHSDTVKCSFRLSAVDMNFVVFYFEHTQWINELVFIQSALVIETVLIKFIRNWVLHMNKNNYLEVYRMS